MHIEKKRVLDIFYAIANSKSTVTSLELAKITGVTERTIKSDMSYVEDFAIKSGAVIKSKRGHGYWAEVIDRDVFQNVVEQLEIHFNYDNLSDESVQKRSNSILRRIITQEGYLKLEDIAEELYLSRSSIKNEIREIRKILESYNLTFETKPGLGSCIKGSEFDRRLCMLALFLVYYHKAVPLFNYSQLMDYFECEDEERNEIRHMFLKVLRESDCRVMDEHTQRIARYLILLRNRYRAGYHVSFSCEDKELLQSFKQHKVACDIIASLKKYGGYDVDENEILALEVLLLVWADIDSNSDMKSDYGEVYDKSLKLSENISRKIESEYSIKLFKSESDKETFITGILPVLLQIRFKREKNDMRLSSMYSDYIRTSPMSMRLAHSAIEVINKQYKTKISFILHLIIANRIYVIICNAKYDYKPIRMIVCSNSGIEAARIIRKSIVERFGGQYFSKSDLYELYEMRALKNEDYDAVALNYPYFSYKYEWPFVLIDIIPTEMQFQEFYKNIILKGYQLEPLLTSFNFNKNFVFRDFDFESMESFIKMISFKYGKESESIRCIEHELKDYVGAAIYFKTCVLFISHQYVDHNIFEIFQLSETKTINDEEISHIIVLSIDFNHSLKALMFIENLTHQLVINKENIYLLTESEKLSNAVDIVRKGLNY